MRLFNPKKLTEFGHYLNEPSQFHDHIEKLREVCLVIDAWRLRSSINLEIICFRMHFITVFDGHLYKSDEIACRPLNQPKSGGPEKRGQVTQTIQL